MNNNTITDDTDCSGRTRRSVLRAGAIAGVTAGILSTGVPSATATGETTPVRRSLASLARSDPDGILPAFAEGIELLRSLDDDDPRHLDAIVEIHGSAEGFNLCEHGNWLFLPWHRAYLHSFEELVREVTGNEAFAVPYWNWLDNPALPSLFRGSETDTLVDPTRTTPSSMRPSITGRERLEPVLSDPNFFRVIGGWAGTGSGGHGDGPADVRVGSGGFEAPAHDYVHVRVGGNMAGGKSPADPAFWAHHSMMDRLWWEWNARGHPNAADDEWLEYSFEGHFLDRDGTPVDVTVEDLLALPEDAYTYDSRIEADGEETDQREQSATADVGLSTVESVPLESGVELTPDRTVSTAFDRERIEPYLTGDADGQLLLTARNVEMPLTESFNVHTHVNSANEATLPPGGPTFAGTYHVFRAPPTHPAQNFIVDLSAVLRDRYERQQLAETVPLTLSGAPMRGTQGEETAATVGSLALEITQSTIDGEVVERSN